MKGQKDILASAIFLLLAGLLNLLQSVGLWQTRVFFAASLVTASGVVIIVAAILIYVGSIHQTLLGVIVFFYSTLGFTAIGLAEADYILYSAIVALILGIIGGAICIVRK